MIPQYILEQSAVRLVVLFCFISFLILSIILIAAALRILLGWCWNKPTNIQEQADASGRSTLSVSFFLFRFSKSAMASFHHSNPFLFFLLISTLSLAHINTWPRQLQRSRTLVAVSSTRRASFMSLRVTVAVPVVVVTVPP